MSLRLNGSTSGYTEINAPAVAGSNTLVLPTGNGTADQALVTNGSGTLSFADRGRMTLGTAQDTTSGASIDFTGIPSWAKRVTVLMSGVSLSGTSNFLIQLGTSSGVITTGYVSATTGYGSTNSSTAGQIMFGALATRLTTAQIQIINVTGSSWIGAANYASDTASVGGGTSTMRVTLSGTLDRIRITTVNGTDTFDAGSVNILIEG